MTLIVELCAGPGAGKTTSAAQLFVELKSRSSASVELVQEYIKLWAWEGKKIKAEDQIYLTAKQMRSEVRLYDKVDIIITDAPIWFGAFYEHRYGNTKRSNLLTEIYYDIMNSVERMRYQVPRIKKYDPRGRYETEEDAKKIDCDMRDWFQSLNIGELPYMPDVKLVADDIIAKLKNKNNSQVVQLSTDYPRTAMEVLANPPNLFDK